MRPAPMEQLPHFEWNARILRRKRESASDAVEISGGFKNDKRIGPTKTGREWYSFKR